MNALNGEDILVAWEDLSRVTEPEAALNLLSLGLPETSLDDLWVLPLAERNALLLELRACTLGSLMDCRAFCPDCGAQLEFALDARTLARGLREHEPNSPQESSAFDMRPTNTLDLLACSKARNTEDACRILLERVVSLKNAAAHAAGERQSEPEAALNDLPPAVTDGLRSRFELMNLAAEIQVRLQCAVCGSDARIDLDIAHYLVREIADAARRLMMDVHELAGAYGWSELAVARMPDQRRAAYLEMLRS